jgi:hypothetical protein
MIFLLKLSKEQKSMFHCILDLEYNVTVATMSEKIAFI